MRVNDDFKDGWNVAAQEEDPESVLSYWKKMIAVRKANPVLVIPLSHLLGAADGPRGQVHGSFTLLDRPNPCVFSFLREWEGCRALVILSFTAGEVMFDLPTEVGEIKGARLLVSTLGDRTRPLVGQSQKLSPFEGRVYLLK